MDIGGGYSLIHAAIERQTSIYDKQYTQDHGKAFSENK